MFPFFLSVLNDLSHSADDFGVTVSVGDLILLRCNLSDRPTISNSEK